MPIKYYLQNNPITPDPNDCSARIQPNAILTQEEIVKKMLQRGSTLTESDILASLKMLSKVVIDEVKDGNNVNLPFVNLRPGIVGVFTSASDSYDASRHTIKATLSAGVDLYNDVQEASVEKVRQPTPTPFILEFTDVVSGSVNSLLSIGGIGSILGEELKFNPANAEEGIFLVPVVGGAAIKVMVIATRTEGKLMFGIPASLAAGGYKLEVRKAYGTANTIRTGELPDTLTVA